MEKQLRTMKALWFTGAILLVAMPVQAFAHDSIGDDELAVSNWMLVAAIVTIVMGGLMGLWAIKSGQFNNVEQSKFNMLDTAEDFDTIMAESDEREGVRMAAEERATQTKHGMKTAGAGVGATTAKASKATRI